MALSARKSVASSGLAASLARRDVLRSMAGLGVLALAGGAGTLLSACTTTQSGGEVLAADPELASLVGSIIGIDMHSHAAGASGRLKPTYDLAERIRAGRMTAVCLSHPGDAPVIRREPDNRIRTVRQPEPGELWRFTQRRLAWFDDLVSGQGFRRALRRGDLDTMALTLVLMVTPFVVSARMLDDVGSDPLLSELERIVDAALRP